MSAMYSTAAFAKHSREANFQKITIIRNEPGEDDVQFDIEYCGICHTDVTYAEVSPNTRWPFVPGHELAGTVTKVGRNVTDVAVGDRVGVGCISDSCQDCSGCNQDLEQYCEKQFTPTYNGPIAHGHIKTDSGYTYGGYSASTTVNRRYIIKVPAGYSLESTGPILCAGITMYSPLNNWNATKGGMRVGIVGIGGLGQMGIRLAKAMGNTVVAFSTSPSKREMALEIGADEFVVSKEAEGMAGVAKSLDLILNTVSADHDVTPFLHTLKREGTLVQLGLVYKPLQITQMVFFRRINLSGSLIGGLRETQECLDFCAKHKIHPTTQLIKADELDAVYEKLHKGNDQILRYVLDVKGSL